MAEKKTVKRKRVNIICSRPFRIGLIPFTGRCTNIVLSVEDIAACLANKAMVSEVLTVGEPIPLGFDNYNTYNGPTDVNDDTKTINESGSTNNKPSEIKRFDNKGNEIKSEVRKPIGGFRKEPKPVEKEDVKPEKSEEKKTEVKAEVNKETVKTVEKEADTVKNEVKDEKTNATVEKKVENTSEVVKDVEASIKLEEANKEKDTKDMEKRGFDYTQQASNFQSGKKKNKW